MENKEQIIANLKQILKDNEMLVNYLKGWEQRNNAIGENVSKENVTDPTQKEQVEQYKKVLITDNQVLKYLGDLIINWTEQVKKDLAELEKDPHPAPKDLSN